MHIIKKLISGILRCKRHKTEVKLGLEREGKRNGQRIGDLTVLRGSISAILKTFSNES